jgi:hypothetical protein
MHTTAMYLPDTLSDVEQKSFVDLVHSTLNYPGDVSIHRLTLAHVARLADRCLAALLIHVHVSDVHDTPLIGFPSGSWSCVPTPGSSEMRRGVWRPCMEYGGFSVSGGCR